MKYLSGIYALNLKCSLKTNGDWHYYSLNWDNVNYLDSEDSIYKSYGIEKDFNLNGKIINKANHIRALLDMINNNDFTNASGINNDFICNDFYDKEIFKKVYLLKSNKNWNDINKFMEKEYKLKWLNFMENTNGQRRTQESYN